jgi:hypothetical protein
VWLRPSGVVDIETEISIHACMRRTDRFQSPHRSTNIISCSYTYRDTRASLSFPIQSMEISMRIVSVNFTLVLRRADSLVILVAACTLSFFFHEVIHECRPKLWSVWLEPQQTIQKPRLSHVKIGEKASPLVPLRSAPRRNRR